MKQQFATERNKMAKQAIKYEVISLPSNRDRLSPQLLSLVNSIEFLTVEINGKKVVERDELYKLWLSEINSDDNDKVFASYIHQLIQFAFLDRMDVKPPKTVEQQKAMLMKQMSLMSKEDRQAIIDSMA